MSPRILLALPFSLCLAAPALADEITDTLQSAIEAYESGDVQYALEELDFARSKLLEMKTDALGAFLPEAPEGWTREVNDEANAAMTMMGGGVAAEADYVAPGGESYRIQMFADNPIVASMSAMITNAGAMGLKTDRIGRQKFAIQDDQTMGLIANRILIQVEGPDAETRKTLLEAMDFAAMASFGS
ncbi:hypothetical protein M4578_14675 [Salipiger sp. P9]|uniref:hypothetical protein n=1 Tax=Salipiger pentaromativorans TaxID=2943193 RepID=UPI0021578ADD|nr:hypothetical protein [Salipiger pentaromativorans]MCR8549080.1 hypothetical protein [Salipiger pentaromativorans]